jgi:hypothetical protein
MEKTINVSRKTNQITVEINLTFDEYLDLRSFFNVVKNSEQWESFNELWSKVPMRFREMLITDKE